MQNGATGSHSFQQRLTESVRDPTTGECRSKPTTDPPVPENQSELTLTSPEETLTEITTPTTDTYQWLEFVEQRYIPPSERDILLLVPCAGTKPMSDSRTYQALSSTLQQYDTESRSRISVVTVSEPMALIPEEFREAFVYDCPGLFKFWVLDNDYPWDKHAQQQCLRVLGERISGFFDRAVENDWYDTTIACVRHRTGDGNHSISQTHRQMLEIAEATSDVDLTWLPTDETVDALVEASGAYGWHMSGVSHPAVQSELSDYLTTALDSGENND